MFKQSFNIFRIFILISTSAFLVACGGSGSDSSETVVSIPSTAAVPTLSFTVSKTFSFSWEDVSDATFYRLQENVDGVSGFTQVGKDVSKGVQSYAHIVPLYKRMNAQYILQSCNSAGCKDSATITVNGNLLEAIAYIKASNTDVDNVNLNPSITNLNDRFGSAISMSADGTTLVVSAILEDSATADDQTDNSAADAGAVYVFVRSGSSWTQQAYLKASNAEAGDQFGTTVSLSADGNTLSVGSYLEDSSATAINGDQTDNAASASGAVYVFTRSDGSWSQQAYIKPSNPGVGDYFGITVSLSNDGNTLAVGSRYDSGENDSLDKAGAAFIFVRSGTDWSQQAYLQASNAANVSAFGNQFGSKLSLSGDGNTLAVGAPREESKAIDVDGDQTDKSLPGAGAVYVFTRSNTAWSQQAYIKASNTDENDLFGSELALSDDGNTLAVGAGFEDGNATGINGDKNDNSASNAGAVYVYARNNSAWSSVAYIKASNTTANSYFGYSLDVSADGSTLAVGALSEKSNAIGLGGDQSNTSKLSSGAVYIFRFNDSSWSQQAYIKASNTGVGDSFATSLALSGDGNTLAVGADSEDSSATGVDGDQSRDDATDAGAVYVY